MIICIGPKTVGKTLLLRRLQQPEILHNPYQEIFATIPTVGVNITKVSFPKKKRVTVTELGGSMAPIWPMHYEGCIGVIYVIDSKNLQQISCASVLLLEALKNSFLQQAKFLVVFNKTDVNNSVSLADVKHLLRMEDVCQHATQEVTAVEASCLTGSGVRDVKQWLMQFC